MFEFEKREILAFPNVNKDPPPHCSRDPPPSIREILYNLLIIISLFNQFKKQNNFRLKQKIFSQL